MKFEKILAVLHTFPDVELSYIDLLVGAEWIVGLLVEVQDVTKICVQQGL